MRNDWEMFGKEKESEAGHKLVVRRALSCALPSGDNEAIEGQRSECRAHAKLFQALFDYFGHRTFCDGQIGGPCCLSCMERISLLKWQ